MHTIAHDCSQLFDIISCKEWHEQDRGLLFTIVLDYNNHAHNRALSFAAVLGCKSRAQNSGKSFAIALYYLSARNECEQNEVERARNDLVACRKTEAPPAKRRAARSSGLFGIILSIPSNF